MSAFEGKADIIKVFTDQRHAFAVPRGDMRGKLHERVYECADGEHLFALWNFNCRRRRPAWHVVRRQRQFVPRFAPVQLSASATVGTDGATVRLWHSRAVRATTKLAKIAEILPTARFAHCFKDCTVPPICRHSGDTELRRRQWPALMQKPLCVAGVFGERAGTRTRDLLIKSQLLYRLSYALVTMRKLPVDALSIP
jgi:hypothetical protein